MEEESEGAWRWRKRARVLKDVGREREEGLSGVDEKRLVMRHAGGSLFIINL